MNLTSSLRKVAFTVIVVGFLPFLSMSQGSGVIQGRVFDAATNESLPFAQVALKPGDAKFSTDIDGLFKFTDLKPGSYNVEVAYAAQTAPFLNVVTDAQGSPLVDPLDPTRYQTKFVDSSQGAPIPTLGLIIEF